jgi:fructose-1,6-bisphosphatase/inositol monophosphatase family enzyme
MAWLVDPIAGTAAFVCGIPLCSTPVALLEHAHGQMTLGVIDNFTTDAFSHAIRGQGAYVTGTPLRVATRPFAQATVVLESRTAPRNDWACATSLVRVVQASHLAQRVLFGYDWALVAQGKIAGVIGKDPCEESWARPPGTLLIEAAGGRVRTLRQDPYDPGNLDVIAATHEVHRTLRAARLV